MESTSLIIVAAVFLAAGAVKGVSGMGLPTVSMALLGLLMPPAEAAMLMVLPSLATNFAQCIGPHWAMLARALWPMWTGLVLAVLFSPIPAIDAPEGRASLVLGLVLAVYGIWGLARPALPGFGRHALFAGGIAGSATGLVTAATGVFVIPMVPYLQALKLPKDVFIQGLGISFMIATVALALRLGSSDVGDWVANGPACAAALFAAFPGLWAGARLRGRLDPAQFQRTLYGIFLLLGLIMAGRSM
ncbi:sulfite exporter TauE/SafE family protein [Thauera sp. SDU_THAU2]|uniref:sulfite exporter TauE/SafE family protein n=1 Tax=Thauera sp. SDU_THAU2 TaxID=3136633 RepID=UPI00311E6FF7